jgi:ribosomal protein S18 acetylase RimI-like enzyme
MTAPSIRLASSADRPAVERIVNAAYTKYIARIGKPPGPMCDDYARRIADQTVWVLIAAGEIAGILVLLEDDDHLLLDNVAVDPRHQGRGIGRALIDFAEQEALRRCYAEIRLYTHQAMHENIILYPRLGYEETGRGEQAGFERVFFRKMLR